MKHPPEKLYSVAELTGLLARDASTLRRQIKAGEFGHDVLDDGGHFLVPASGVRKWQGTRRRVFDRDGVLVESPQRRGGFSISPRPDAETTQHFTQEDRHAA